MFLVCRGDFYFSCVWLLEIERAESSGCVGERVGGGLLVVWLVSLAGVTLLVVRNDATSES